MKLDPGANVILAGPMGCGKTSIGKELARRLGRPFLDTDALIEAETRKTIREIFSQSGEAEFRRLEHMALKRATGLRNTVIAVGGGALMEPQNRALVKESGISVALTASPEVILKRTSGDDARPLISGETEGARLRRIEELLRERLPGLAECDYLLDTSGMDVEESLQAILGFLSKHIELETTPKAKPASFEADLYVEPTFGKPYPIFIGQGLLRECGRLLREGPSGASLSNQVLVITNTLVGELYATYVKTSLEEQGFGVNQVTLPDGEEYKSLETAGKLYDYMAERRVGRKTPVLALGGGVIGDLAGFVASTYMRGIPLVQLPTTLLAQVDSSVGGKVAVNHPMAKNLIGSFYQPVMVIADIDALLSLPDREYAEGLAEVVKYGISMDRDFFEFQEKRVEALLRRQPQVLDYVVKRSCQLKAGVVKADERESGPRMVLNFGHTVGHAIEASSGYGRLRHGEAVSIGMAVAMRVARELGLMSEAELERGTGILRALGLPTETELDYEAIHPFLSLDKKASSGRIRFVLPRGIGDAVIADEVNPDLIKRALRGRQS